MSSQIVVGAIVSVLALIIGIVVGVAIIGSLQTTVGTMSLAAQGSTVVTQLFNVTWSSINLMTILPLVAIAGTIIAAVFIYLRYIR